MLRVWENLVKNWPLLSVVVGLAALQNTLFLPEEINAALHSKGADRYTSSDHKVYAAERAAIDARQDYERAQIMTELRELKDRVKDLEKSVARWEKQYLGLSK